MLGIPSVRSCNELFELNLLEQEITKTSRSLHKFTRASVDRLLRQLWKPTSSLTENARKIPRYTKLTKLVARLVLSPASNAGYDLEKGLSGVHAFPIEQYNKSRPRENRLDLSQAADILRIGTPLVQNLVKTGYLTRYHDPVNNKRVLLSKEEVECFDKQYVFSGFHARSIGVGPKNIIDRLYKLGVIPAGGPRINGLTSHLISRDDLAAIDCRVLKEVEGSSIKNAYCKTIEEIDHQLAETSLSASTVALFLGLSVAEVAKLIRKGILEQIRSSQTAIMVSRASFEIFSAKFNDKNLVEIGLVAKNINETLRKFCAKWIKTEIVTVIDLGIRKCILKNSYQRIIELKNEYMTNAEVTTCVAQGASILPDLEKRGLISSIKLGKEGGLKLYSRKAIQDIVKRGLLNASGGVD